MQGHGSTGQWRKAILPLGVVEIDFSLRSQFAGMKEHCGFQAIWKDKLVLRELP